jgi:hypothetical protein
MNKTYLGDGVYATSDERGTILTTENGWRVTNTIVLESEVMDALLKFLLPEHAIDALRVALKGRA